jgi:hypothetical protein
MDDICGGAVRALLTQRRVQKGSRTWGDNLHLAVTGNLRKMAFLTAYLDESKSDPIFVLAGLVSTAHNWNRFSREWGKVLKEYQIPYLHMKEFAFSKGPFQGWSESRRKALLQRFLFLIKSGERIHSFSCIFNYRQYDHIFPPRFRQQQDHYFFAFQNCIVSMKSFCDRHNLAPAGEKIDLVFDNQAQFAQRALQVYAKYKSIDSIPEEHRNIISSLSFADDQEVMPLQASDLLAYEINKNRRGFIRTPGIVLNKLKGSHSTWNNKMLGEYGRRMQAQLPDLFA